MDKAFFKISTGVLHLISLLPFSVLYLLADMIYFAMYRVVGYRKDVVRTNLKNAFPEKTDAERKLIEKKFYRFLADMMLETIKMSTMSAKDFEKRVKLTVPEVIQNHLNNNKSVLIVSGHYGNWEWGSVRHSTYYNELLLVIFKPLTDKNFENYFNKIRSRFGAVTVPMKLTLRKIIEYKDEKFCIGFAGDQTPVKGEARYFTTFLNQPTAVFLGVEKIAKMTNHPVVFGNMERVRRGYYECWFKTLFENPKEAAEYEITEAHTKALEEVIKARPEFWLWSHKRWKFKPEDVK